MIFLTPEVHRERGSEIRTYLADHLPYTFRGIPTNFSAPDPTDHGTQLLEETKDGPVNHRVEILTLPGFLESYLGIARAEDLGPLDWLTIPEQKLRSLTAGAVFYDGLDAGLRPMRSALSYYPRDIWIYQMAAAWARIGQEEHLMGRAGSVGDEVGSAIIGARLVRDLMRLVFLIDRTYAPYPKWFGTAFRSLEHGEPLYPVLERALHATHWREREEALVEAYEAVAVLHNRLGLTREMPTSAREFFGRPFRVLAIEGFADALLELVDTHVVGGLLRRSPIGGIDQVSDNTEILEDLGFRPSLRALYERSAAIGEPYP